MVKILRKHASGKSIDAAIELRKLLGPQDKLCSFFNISPQAFSRREKAAIDNGTGITKEHCSTLITLAIKRRHELYDLMKTISDLEGIPINEFLEVEDDCEACRLGGKGEKKCSE